MMASPQPERLRFDPATPNTSRMADYYLGGKDNFAADREVAQIALSLAPELPAMAREGRAFLGRVVRFLAGAGIRQFVDIGCGLPMPGGTHQVLRDLVPDARVVYVDNDPMVVVHTQAVLKEGDAATVVEADLRDPEGLLAHPGLTGTIDLDRPVAFLLLSVLSHLPDDLEAAQVVAALQKAMTPGSHLAVSHAVSDLRPETTARLAALYQERGSITGPYRANLRTRAEVECFFDGLRLVEPGLVYIPEWRPDRAALHSTESIWTVGGVGVKE
ncbi:SAM-dependent methyltransferase [Streptosporangium sp. NPDC050855]|uniref:SAM-dependent methyltransferase n=1 Tax=Streptosporangium sp. NPDC050855 TaxID=3366194 RepID=UPI0037B9157A